MIEPSLTGLERVRAALADLNLESEIVSPGVPMPTVPLAAAAVRCHENQIIKTVVFMSPDGKAIVGIVNGTGRIDRERLAKAAGVAKLTLANPGFVQERTGYPAGGVSPIGIRDPEARIFIDPAVLDQDYVYGGAGTEDDLLKLHSTDLVHFSGGTVAAISR